MTVGERNYIIQECTAWVLYFQYCWLVSVSPIKILSGYWIYVNASTVISLLIVFQSV